MMKSILNKEKIKESMSQWSQYFWDKQKSTLPYISFYKIIVAVTKELLLEFSLTVFYKIYFYDWEKSTGRSEITSSKYTKIFS